MRQCCRQCCFVQQYVPCSGGGGFATTVAGFLRYWVYRFHAKGRRGAGMCTCARLLSFDGMQHALQSSPQSQQHRPRDALCVCYKWRQVAQLLWVCGSKTSAPFSPCCLVHNMLALGYISQGSVLSTEDHTPASSVEHVPAGFACQADAHGMAWGTPNPAPQA